VSFLLFYKPLKVKLDESETYSFNRMSFRVFGL
jgi:hypothetical protein